jgi:hypothetical protein
VRIPVAPPESVSGPAVGVTKFDGNIRVDFADVGDVFKGAHVVTLGSVSLLPNT